LAKNEPLHVSGSSSAHHQEFIHCTLGTGICHTGLKTAFEQAHPGDSKIKTELLDWFETITQQNYFRHNDKTITQSDGLAMGAPSSSIITEIFLQHIEHTHTSPT
jgi:hypothetical protein